ncbi:MAG: Stk1 family PASTA domain-containing Ser/Thr kinase [Nocardioidaceae bacterium]
MDRSATADPLIGRVLDGRYAVGDKIARGGMATVYVATDLRLDRLVALKVLPHALADDEEFAQRFAREARSAARLAHPNVVAVYDQSADDGVLFLVMEYVAGRHTLRDVIQAEAPLPPVRALSLLEEILKAIEAAHHSGLIHRDIKPENVLIDPRGQVKVADFGLARAISSATSATATGGVLMGTVSYLPPELVTHGIADARSDVYSLGIVAFELLTGAKPHAGQTPIQVAYQHVHEDVGKPSDLVEGIPPYVDALVARATSRDRDLRPADAHVMLQQLRRVRHALDHGVVEDQELTDDLTPTVAIAALSGDDLSAGGSTASTRLASTGSGRLSSPDRDEVFDFAAHDAEAATSRTRAHPRFAPAGGVERTLLVGADRDRARSDVTSERNPTDRHRGSTTTARAMGTAGSSVVTASPPWQRSRKRGWLAFFIVLLLAAGAAAGGWYYGVGRFQSTPDLVKMSQSEAAAAVAAEGLHFRVARTAYSERIPAGQVISTAPETGQKILPAGTVAAVISKGPERHDVPDLTKMSQAEAVKAIEANSLRAGPIKKIWSEDVQRGAVISFRPRADVPLKRDASVSLVISRGSRADRGGRLHGQSGHSGGPGAQGGRARGDQARAL